MNVLPLVQLLNDIIKNLSSSAFLICHAQSDCFHSQMHCLPRGYNMVVMDPDATSHTQQPATVEDNKERKGSLPDTIDFCVGGEKIILEFSKLTFSLSY